MHSSNFQLLTENPPPKSPYFTLPDVAFLTQPVRRPGTETIVGLWGYAGKMSEDHTTDFLLELIKYSRWDPDFEAVADEWGVNSSKIVNRFKSIVENRKYTLEDDVKVTGGNGPPKPDPPKPKQTRKQKSAANNEAEPVQAEDSSKKKAASKKRKADGADEPIAKPKKRKRTSKDAAKAESAENAENADAEDDDRVVSDAPKKNKKTKAIADEIEIPAAVALEAPKKKRSKKAKADANDAVRMVDDDNDATPFDAVKSKNKKNAKPSKGADDTTKLAANEDVAESQPIKKTKSKKPKESAEAVEPVEPLEVVEVEVAVADGPGSQSAKETEPETAKDVSIVVNSSQPLQVADADADADTQAVKQTEPQKSMDRAYEAESSEPVETVELADTAADDPADISKATDNKKEIKTAKSSGNKAQETEEAEASQIEQSTTQGLLEEDLVNPADDTSTIEE